MSDVDIIPYEIWCEIFGYCKYILKFRLICKEIKMIIDKCKYLDWNCRKIHIKNGKIKLIIKGINNVVVTDKSDNDVLIYIRDVKILNYERTDIDENKINNIMNELFPDKNLIDKSSICFDNNLIDSLIETLDNEILKKIIYREIYRKNRKKISSKKVAYYKIINLRHLTCLEQLIYTKTRSVIYGNRLPVTLIKLDCSFSKVRNLNGLINLRELICVGCNYIMGEKISNTLIQLDCTSTNIGNISHLYRLKKLICIKCSYMLDSDLPRNIIELFCDKTNIKNIQHLKCLEKISGSGCPIIYDKLPKGLKDIRYIKIVLCRFQKLERYNCSLDKKITGIKIPISMIVLSCLRTNIMKLDHLINLRELYCTGCREIMGKNLPISLIILSCKDCKSIKDLSHLINLEELICDGCRNIPDKNLPCNIIRLCCQDTNVRSVKHLKKLNYINCKYCNIFDIKYYIKNMKNIEYTKDYKKYGTAKYKLMYYCDMYLGDKYLVPAKKSIFNKHIYIRCTQMAKTYKFGDIVTIGIKCDNNMHNHGKCNRKKEEAIIKNLIDNYSDKMKYVILRWNPDDYNPPKGVKKKTIEERLDKVVKMVKKLYHVYTENNIKRRVTVYYMYYNVDYDKIIKNIKTIFVW